MCLSIIADLLEVNQILEHQLTHAIMIKKYSKLFNSLDAQLFINSNKQRLFYQPITIEYLRYLGSSRFELEELDIEEKRYDISRMHVQCL